MRAHLHQTEKIPDWSLARTSSDSLAANAAPLVEAIAIIEQQQLYHKVDSTPPLKLRSCIVPSLVDFSEDGERDTLAGLPYV